MLEKPDIKAHRISACLLAEYGLGAKQIAFLPLGADSNTAVYRVDADDGTPYFLKLRKGDFDESAVALPKFLSDQGIKQVIPPLESISGQLWADLDSYKTILYPFIAGRNGYEVTLLDQHWREFGTALKRIHTAPIPPAQIGRIRREEFSSHHRQLVTSFISRVDRDVFADPVAIQLVTFLSKKRDEILKLIQSAQELAQSLQQQSFEFIVCHSDIHAGNIFIGCDDALYIVDWDEPILAPKERDLMYIGGGLLASGLTPQEEEARFYQTYGDTDVDLLAVAYYRCERIIQDIAAYCEQLLLTNEGGADREQSLGYLKSNFLPNSTIEIAYRSGMK
jgi:spectinomycin phosphotransferase